MLTKYLRKIPFYEKYFQSKLREQSKFYGENRIKVILSYRFLLKTIPKIYPRMLQRAQKIHEARYFFKESKFLSDIDQTKVRTKLALQIVQDIKNNKYERLGDFVPNYRRDQRIQMVEETRKFVGKRKRWWLSGYIN